jgi:hypothetical protein
MVARAEPATKSRRTEARRRVTNRRKKAGVDK